jgi:CRP-like cAMP-binding protein
MDYEFVAELQLIMRPTSIEKSEMICRIGEIAEEIFVLKNGEAQVHTTLRHMASGLLLSLLAPWSWQVAESQVGQDCAV